MAYPYGGDPPVARQLNYLGQILRGGMSDIGDLDLARAKLNYEMTNPANALARTQAQDTLDEITRMKNTPATIYTILGENAKDPVSLEHFFSNILPDMETHGVTTRETYPVVGKGEKAVPTFFSKTTGKPLTEWDFYNRHNLTVSLIIGNTHPGKKLEQLVKKGVPGAQKQLDDYNKDPGPWFDAKIGALLDRRSKVKPEMQATIDKYIDKTNKEREEAIRKSMPAKKPAGLTWDEWKEREDYKEKLLRGRPSKTKGAGEGDEFDWKAFDAFYSELFYQPINKDTGEPMGTPVADSPVSVAKYNALKTRADNLGLILIAHPAPDGEHMIITNLVRPKDTTEEVAAQPGMTTSTGVKPDYIYTREGGFRRP